MQWFLVSDRRMNIRMIAEMVGLTKPIVHQIVEDKIQMREDCDKLTLQIDPVNNKMQR